MQPRPRAETSSPWLPSLRVGSIRILSLNPEPAPALTGSANFRGEAVEAEELDVVERLAGIGQIGHDLAHDAAELVAVAGEPRRDNHLRMSRVLVEHEVTIRT